MRKKIMVVDDDPNIVKLLTFLLEKWGYEVSHSRDGLDCMSVVEYEKPDLVLLDIMMPGLDGISVCSEITTSFNIPVIIVSGLKKEKIKEESEVFGALEFVPKPINSSELKKKVEKALQ
jgi:DNA-binding response OmpR family regulator